MTGEEGAPEILDQLTRAVVTQTTRAHNRLDKLAADAARVRSEVLEQKRQLIEDLEENLQLLKLAAEEGPEESRPLCGKLRDVVTFHLARLKFPEGARLAG